MSTQSYNTGNTIYDSNGGNQNVIADYAYISDLLSNIPDNNTNLIDAKDVRDAVWTLWNRIEDINTGLSSSGINIYGTASGTFDERKSAILTTLQKSQEFLHGIAIADERKQPWEITRTTEIRPLTDAAFHALINHVESLIDDAGIVV